VLNVAGQLTGTDLILLQITNFPQKSVTELHNFKLQHFARVPYEIETFTT